MKAALLVVLAFSPARAEPAKLDLSNQTLVSPCVEPDPLLGHHRKPGCSGWGSRGGARVWMSYNALGIRDKDFPPRPAPGVLRVLAAGGSIMGGSGLEAKDLPANALERALRKRGLKAEVINAAGDGYTGWQNAVVLERYLAAYRPKAVVYHLASQYLFTDRSWSRELLRHEGKIAGVRPLAGFLPESWRRGHGLLVLIWAEQWDRLRASWTIAFRRGADRKLDYLMKPTLEILGQMREACGKSGARFFVVYAGEEANADYFVLPRRPPALVRFEQKVLIRPFAIEGALVAARLREAGFEVLDISADRPALEAPENRLPGDYHWNAKGAGLFGEAAAGAFARAWKAAP